DTLMARDSFGRHRFVVSSRIAALHDAGQVAPEGKPASDRRLRDHQITPHRPRSPAVWMNRPSRGEQQLPDMFYYPLLSLTSLEHEKTYGKAGAETLAGGGRS